MLRCAISSASGSLSLTSASIRRAVPRFSAPLHHRLGSRAVTYTYKPFALRDYDAVQIAENMEKRRYPPGKAGFEKRRKDEQSRPRVTEGSPDQVLDIEATTLLERLRNEKGTDARDKDTDDLKSSSAQTEKPEAGTELQLEIQELSSTGDGLAYSPDKDHDLVFVVPFSVPGDKVLAKTDPQKPDSHQWMKVDFVKLLSPSPSRDGVTPQCRYFGTCSGCQLQMLPYQEQLAHKKTIIEKAFKHFSNLDPSLIPPVEETIGSPLQYGYRTKITPHYDGTHKSRPWKEGDQPPPFGFTKKNVSKILDIEQCPIATDILNEGLKIERKNVADTFWKKSTGATVLLRESTKREVLSSSQATKARTLSNSKDTATNGAALAQDLSRLPLEYPGSPTSTSVSFSKPSVPEITYTYPSFQDTKTYTSDHKAFTTEHIGPYTYTTLANSFFQNNNSILPTFLSYIRDQILPKTPAISATGETYTPKIKYLLDAYCGSGLFSIALASEFSSVLGIDIDALGIQCARENATINNPQKANGQSNLGFIAADATAIFEDVPYPADQTLCIIDPPRKGASPDFLKQLCAYGPKRVVYVSCNVHTQARDVGMLVAGLGGKEHKSWRYSIEKVGGFDFFPQTGHVEGVCFLNRVEEQ